MAMSSLTYDEYAALGGEGSEDDFSRLLPAAVRYVDDAIWPNAVDTDARADAYRAALAAAIDVDRQWGRTHGTRTGGSVAIGRYSESGGTGEGSYDSDLGRAVHAALAGSGLLCRVVVL